MRAAPNPAAAAGAGQAAALIVQSCAAVAAWHRAGLGCAGPRRGSQRLLQRPPSPRAPPLLDPVERRVSTVGRIHPHLEAKVIDPDTGALLPRGEVGGEAGGAARGAGALLARPLWLLSTGSPSHPLTARPRQQNSACGVTA